MRGRKPGPKLIDDPKLDGIAKRLLAQARRDERERDYHRKEAEAFEAKAKSSRDAANKLIKAAEG